MSISRILLRGGTEAEWRSSASVLALREPGVAHDTGEIRYGNGVDTWANLPSPLNVYVAVGGDETAALNTFLSATTPVGVKHIIGNATVSGTLLIPAGVYVDASRAKITQTASNATTFELAADTTLVGGSVYGKATDYVAATNISPTAIGAKVTGANASIRFTKFFGHAGAGIFLSTGATNFRSTGVEVSGEGLAIPALDSACFGVYVAAGCPDPDFTGLHIHHTSIGIIASVDTARLAIRSSRIHDIAGQHGVYVQNGVGLHVEGLTVWNVNLNGFKLQMFASNLADAEGMVIDGLTCDGCGDAGVSINNTDAALTRKYRGLSIANVVVSNSLRGIYLGSVRTGAMSNIVVRNCSGDGVTLLDCWDVTGSINLETIGQVGLRITSATNGSNARIRLDATIRNPANGGVANNLYGVYVAEGTDIRLDPLVVTATNGTMQYGLFFAGGDQKSFTLANADLSGSTGTDVRLLAGPVRVKGWLDVRLAGTVLNFPTAIATRVGGRGLTSQYVINGALPTADVFKAGDEILNGAPAVGGPKSWLCTAAGGLHGGTWAASTAYTVGTWRRTSVGRVMECTVAGTSGATEPAPTAAGEVITDGTVTWTVRAMTIAAFASTGNL